VTAPATLPPLEHDPGAVRDLAEDVLSGSGFTASEPGPVRQLLDRALDALAGTLAEVVSGASGSAVLAWVVVGLGTVLLAGVVWRLTATASLDRRRAVVPDARTGRVAADWRRAAAEAAAAGRDPDAVRLRYRAAVTELVEAGVLDDVPGRTVRELDVRLAEGAPGVAPRFAAAGRAFEEVWYGHRPVIDEHREAVRAADEAARALAHPRRRRLVEPSS
jgi:hypothetical protein